MNTSNTIHMMKHAFLPIFLQKLRRMGLYGFAVACTILCATTMGHAYNAGFFTMGIRLHEGIQAHHETENTPQKETEVQRSEAYMPTAGIAEVEHTAIDDYGTLDVAIWFPTNKIPQTITMGRWQIQAARNAKPSMQSTDGRFPLVIISHASGELRLSHHSLASFLAQNGFVVAALTHPHDCNTDMSAMFTLQQLVHRPQHVTRLLDVLLENPQTSTMIDTQHIAFIGFGVGGTTGLSLAGGVPSPALWPNYCKRALPTDIYCGSWARQRLDTMALALNDAIAIPQNKTEKSKKGEELVAPIYPKMPPLRDTRIQSFALITPAYGMFFPASSLKNVTAPILLVQAAYDSMNQKPFHAEALRIALPTTPEFFHLKEAGYFSLRDVPDLAPRHSDMRPANNEYPSKNVADEESNIASLEPILSQEDKTATQAYVQKRILDFLLNSLKL